MKDPGVFGGGEIAAVNTPVTDGFCHPADQLADTGFAGAKLTLSGAYMAVQVLGSHDVGRGHRPVDRNFDVFLLEDGSAGGVRDGGGTALPSHLAVRRDAWLGEEAGAVHAAGGF